MGLKREKIVLGVLIVAVIAGFLVVHFKRTPFSPPKRSTTGTLQKAGPLWAYPDPARTPGFANPDITQANIEETICNPGCSTRSIRPSSSYTTRVKKQQLREWGLPGTAADYEEDHFISLELGGDPTDPRNLWPEPYSPRPGAKEKDVVENYLHKQVCSGTMTLQEAQRDITTDWYKIYLRVHQ